MKDDLNSPRVRWFRSIGLEDLQHVGGKNASLGELQRDLSSNGIDVPMGFATTVDAYFEYLDSNGLTERIRPLLSGLDVRDVETLRSRAKTIRDLIMAAKMPMDLEHEIAVAYDSLCKSTNCLAGVAVRSSATAEDLPEASFAGQQETFLNVRGSVQLIEACKKCYASLFTDRAIVYRSHLGIDHFTVGLSIGIQQMVRADLGAAGVMFTLDTESGFRDVVLINAAYGLGETVVQGTVNPDEYLVFKPTLMQGFSPIVEKRLGSKEFKLIFDPSGERPTKTIPVPVRDREKFVLSDADILQLSKWACAIERHYSDRYGRDIPMDIEWAKDGETGRLFILQARPETVQSRKVPSHLENFVLQKRSKILAEGRSVGSRIGAGPARVIERIEDLELLQPGEILVTEKTNPDWEPVLKRASAIVTEQGGRTCHAAIVARELGIPAVVGVEHATRELKTGREITVSCAEGEIGRVYEGALPFRIEQIDLKDLAKPRTKIMMNVADPSQAFRLSFLPNDGVGLAREELIINHYVKVHPMALLHPEKIESAGEKAAIFALTQRSSDGVGYFVERLSEGIAKIAAAFYPKEVILRFSDFKTNEYAHLWGGSAFEPHEENPMLGFRGASRYYSDSYREGFALECRAVDRVRRVMGLRNLKLMIPFCRTVEEGKLVLAEMEKNGLKRGEDGLEVYVMCEIPSNVISADRFAQIFDGFSIGSNDLTQLVLGVDRDSALVAGLFDERNPAVKDMIAKVIRSAKANGRKIGICGQAPSDYPEFAEFVVREGIDSLSLNPDAVLKTTQNILSLEKILFGPNVKGAAEAAP